MTEHDYSLEDEFWKTCPHEWRYVEDGDSGNFWWCPTCGTFVWTDDPTLQPAMTTSATGTTRWITMPSGSWDIPALRRA